MLLFSLAVATTLVRVDETLFPNVAVWKEQVKTLPTYTEGR